MNLYQLPEEQILLFAAMLLRVIGFFVAMPIIGTPAVPVHLKVLLSVSFAIVMFPVVQALKPNFAVFSDALILVCMKEVVVGLFLGFLVRMFFFSMTIAGEIVGMSAGLSASQMFNPAIGDQSTAFETFHVMMGTTAFLIMGGHHYFIEAFGQSFQFLPVTSMGFNTLTVGSIVEMGQQVIATGFRLATPVWLSILVSNIAMGLLGRAVPQINIFVMSFHVTIFLGFGIVILMLPLFMNEIGTVVESMAIGFGEVVKSL